MYALFARNREDRRECIFIDLYVLKDKAFDFAYKHKDSFYTKGGWLIEVECLLTGQLVEDDRLLA